MIVKIGDGARLIVDVINNFLGVRFGQFRRAMYKNIAGRKCLWFPQVSLRPIGVQDVFKQSLSADNWLSADGKELYEKARNVHIENTLSNNDSLVRITFANIIPIKGYSFIGIFKYVGKRDGYRVYKRVSSKSDTTTWRRGTGGK